MGKKKTTKTKKRPEPTKSKRSAKSPKPRAKSARRTVKTKKAARTAKKPKRTAVARPSQKKAQTRKAKRQQQISRLLEKKAEKKKTEAKKTKKRKTLKRKVLKFKETEKKVRRKKTAKFKKADLEKLKNALLQEKERIQEQLRRLERLSATDGTFRTADEIPHHSMHIAEFASDNQAIDAAIGLRSLKEEQLAQIEEALEKIERGEYGICESCGGMIDIERLLVLPSAKFCLECKKKIETGGGF